MIKVLTDRFNMEELKEVSYDTGITWESLHGDTIGEKARELVLKCYRTSRANLLVAKILSRRPGVFDE